MAELSGFPCCEVQFRKDGNVNNQAELDAALQYMSDPAHGVTDVFVISHGWNNNLDEARDLYARFFATMRDTLNRQTDPKADGRNFAIIAIFWPSMKWTDPSQIAGGAAALDHPIDVQALQSKLEELKEFFNHPTQVGLLDLLKGLATKLQDDPAVQQWFTVLARLLPPRDGDPEDASDRFYGMSGDQLLKKLGGGGLDDLLVNDDARDPRRAQGAGGAAGIADWIGDVINGAKNLLNFTTYYEMKARSGTVGSTGVNAMLGQLRESLPRLRIHLIGHSFGGRLVTAAAGGKRAFAPQTMSLLQAAFSHNGFGQNFDNGGHDGFFRSVVAQARVKGPILVTHSVKDEAVGVAYPLASRLAGQRMAALGDANDPYGGIGRNGAQHTPEAIFNPLLAFSPASKYQFDLARHVFNLNGDAIITGHSDVCRNEICQAILSAVLTT